MRSLVVKLTLAFLLVGLTGAILVAVITRQMTQTAFSQFILDRDQQVLVNILEQYYQVNGSWQGVVDFYQAQLTTFDHPNPGAKNQRRGLGRFIVIDINRNIVLSSDLARIGQPYPSRGANNAVALESNGQAVGWLVIIDAPPNPEAADSPETIFLARVNGAVMLSALAASGLALILGGLLAYTLTRSLRELREATDEIARGNLGLQVKIRSRDELGDLATSFNRMSTDLARATQARRQMTADIAHDLRTPLSVIAGYTEALSDGKLPGNVEVYGILYQETQCLHRLVDDLRILSLADAGELPLTLQLLPAQSLLAQAAARHAVAAQEKGITLQVVSEPGLPKVKADPERMAQVFDNLIGNALRHTPAGGEIVLAGQLHRDQLQFQVRDTGSGITPEDLPNVFERLYRGDKSRHSNGESGLGLAIARSIIEAHGGAIGVQSRQGEGTTFTITLPAAAG